MSHSPATPLDDLLGYHLRRASSVAMGDLADRLARLGLRVTEASILVVLEAHPLSTQSEIGRRLGIRRANMAPLVADLSAAGLVERGTVAGRSHPLRLSAFGRERTVAVRAVMEDHDRMLFGALPDEVRAALISTLGEIWRGHDAAARVSRAA